jgi:energy-coupling factor transporter transmembrane protein EcfT
VASLSPFRFEWGEGPARRLHPLSKLAVLLSLSLASAGAGAAGLVLLGLLAAAVLVLSGAFRHGLKEGLRVLFQDARFLLPLALVILVFRVLDPFGPRLLRLGELPGCALYIARLVLVFAYAEAFFRSTTTGELAAGTSALARALFRRRDIDPGLYLSLAVGFIPRCFEAWERTRDAALARGYTGSGGHAGGGSGGRGRVGALRRLRASLLLLESFIASSIAAALRTADALDARAYDPGRSLAPTRLKPADLLAPALALSAALAAALV